MSELGEIHEKINNVGLGVARIETRLDTVLPHLATHDHVDLKIAEHAAIKPSIAPQANGYGKKIGMLISVIVALAGAIVYLVQAG